MSKWPSIAIGEMVAAGEVSLQTGPFGTQLKAADYVDEGVPVINVRNIGFGTIRAEKLEFVANDTRDRLSVHVLRLGDVVFGRKGAVERHVLIRSSQDGWLQGSDCIRMRFNSQRVLPAFASAFFLTPEHQQWMKNLCSHAATMASLNQPILERIPLPVPSLRVQRRIAGLLSAYDDLIENCERRIRVLDEMARSLYREWFVDRSPVPTQRTTVPLREVADVNAAKVDARNPPATIGYIDIASVSPGRIDAINPFAFDDAPGRARRVVRHGDTLWSCVRPNRRSHALVVQPDANTIASTGFAVLTPRRVPASYLYLATATDEFVGYLEKRATGAAYPAVTGKDFEEALLVLPADDVLAKFGQLADTWFAAAAGLAKRIKNLRATRDLLLPRLLSGQLSVDDAA